MWPLLYLPKGDARIENMNYRVADLTNMIQSLMKESFNGYMEILALHEKGLVIFYKGKVVSCYYEGTDELELTKEQIIRHFLQTETRERDTIINVYELNSSIIESTSALETPTPAHRELESAFLDMNKLVETLSRKKFTGVIRFYRIRNNTRLGNLLLKMNKISPEQLKEAVRLQLSQGGAKRLGDALVEIGAIAQAELEDALDRQSYTRKGSDLEIAISLFHEGQFLGGYAQDNGILITNLQKVMSWMVGGREILMDIIESHMPTPVAIVRLLEAQQLIEGKAVVQSFQTLKQEVKTIEKQTSTEAAIKAIANETFSLKADDLILDGGGSELLHEESENFKQKKLKDSIEENKPVFSEPVPQVVELKPPKTIDLVKELDLPIKKEVNYPVVEKKESPERVTVVTIEPTVNVPQEQKNLNDVLGEQAARIVLPEKPANSVDEPNQLMEEKVSETLSVKNRSRSLSDEEGASQDKINEWFVIIQEIFRDYLGFIGKAIFNQEYNHSIIAGRVMTLAQFRVIVKRSVKMATMIAGSQAVSKMEDIINEELGVTA